MGDMNYLLFIIVVLVTPAIVLGMFAVLPIWLLWLIQKLLHRQPSKFNWIGIVSVGLFSFMAVLSLYVYSIINIDYIFTIPSSPIAAEKLKYENDAIAEAFQRSIIPPLFQKPCVDKPELVCKLGASYSLKLWDSNLISDGEPFVGGFVSSITSMLFVILGSVVFQKRKINSNCSGMKGNERWAIRFSIHSQ
jgi:energy-coupling factor transporter transmembrane protein EcfT